jgi:hypothetical protein
MASAGRSSVAISRPASAASATRACRVVSAACRVSLSSDAAVDLREGKNRRMVKAGTCQRREMLRGQA